MPLLSASGVSPYNKIRGGGGVELPFTFGNALEFDGVNDYVALNSGAVVLTTAFDWTISLWIKPSKTGVSLGGDNSSANDLLYLINSTLFRVQFAGGSAALSRLNFTIPTVTLNEWHHVCITKDSSNDVRMYWDGTESVTGALPTNDTLNMYQLGSYRRVGLWFSGVMDEFGLDITTAASSSQVSDLYNSGNGASFLKVMPSARINHHFNEVSGSSVAVDATTNGHDATLNNFNTSTCWVAHTPYLGNALGLNGINQYGVLTTRITTSTTTTISCWLKFDAFGGVFYGNSASSNVAIRAISSTVIRWYSGSGEDFTVPAMTIGAKYHLVFTITGTDIRCYLNAVESTTGARTTPATIINQIGIYSTGSGFWFDGEVNELAFDTTQVATPTNITALYNGGLGDNYLSVMGVADAYYQFNESDGTDSSGNGNTMTLFNSPTFPTF